MDIDVVVITLSAPIWHIQRQALYLHIMGDATVPWFGLIPPIGCQGTQKMANKMMWMMTKWVLQQQWMS
jgi:hypothetical protein